MAVYEQLIYHWGKAQEHLNALNIKIEAIAASIITQELDRVDFCISFNNIR